MNQTNPQPNGTFCFKAVVSFNIDPETAASLLVESDPSPAISRWLNARHPVEDSGDYNTENLKIALGCYLRDRAIDQARRLLPDADPKAQLPF